MKVAVIDPSLFTAPYDRALVDSLRALGDSVRFYTKSSFPGDLASADTADADAIQHFYPLLTQPFVKRLPSTVCRVLKGISHIGDMDSLVGSLRQWQPDVIHFQWVPLPIIDRKFLPVLRRIAPLILTVHDSDPFNGDPTTWVQRLGSIPILNQFDALVVHTEQARSRLTAQGVPSAKITKIMHGLLHEAGSGLESLPDVEAISGGVVDFLLFGKVKPYKGVDMLIRAVALLSREERSKCRVRVVGMPCMGTSSLSTLAASLGVADCIQFDFRFVADGEIASVFAPASVLVFPYRSIDTSGVLMTAISAGRPIIATNIGTFAEILSDGRDALLVPPGDQQALAQALRRVIEDVALRHQLAAGIRCMRGAIPTWQEIGRSTQELYVQLTKCSLPKS